MTRGWETEPDGASGRCLLFCLFDWPRAIDRLTIYFKSDEVSCSYDARTVARGNMKLCLTFVKLERSRKTVNCVWPLLPFFLHCFFPCIFLNYWKVHKIKLKIDLKLFPDESTILMPVENSRKQSR